MRIPVRSEPPDAKLLFEWDADDDVIEIIRKKDKYKVKLIRDGQNSHYKVLGQARKKNAED